MHTSGEPGDTVFLGVLLPGHCSLPMGSFIAYKLTGFVVYLASNPDVMHTSGEL